jgi:hypothetical protein
MKSKIRKRSRSKSKIKMRTDGGDGTGLKREGLFLTPRGSSFPGSARERPGATLRVARAAERPGRHSHAEHGNEVENS